MILITCLLLAALVAWLAIVLRADEGFSTTLNFASSFCAELQSVSLSGYARNAIETTHMTSTSGWRTFQPSDLKDPGTLTAEISFRPNDDIPISSAAASATVTFPTPAGGSTGATLACSMFLTSFEFTDPMDERMTASVEIKLSGVPTWTDST